MIGTVNYHMPLNGMALSPSVCSIGSGVRQGSCLPPAICNVFMNVFTALHGMQTRSSDEKAVKEKAVRLSVCQSRGL